MQTKQLTTEELAVSGVAVVAESKGKVFLGPYYDDQLEELRSDLRGMRRRERWEVAPDGEGFSIYRKPSEGATK